MVESRLIKVAKIILFKAYDHEYFWNVRHALCLRSVGPVKELFYKIYYKKELRRSCSDIALGFDDSTGRTIENFKSPPNLTMHGLNGIIIAGGAQFGSNVTISQQVTVGRSRGGVPIIGDNVYIGPGAKIFGAIHIGNNVNIGANCVVFEDIPDNSTVVLDKPRIILRDTPRPYYASWPDEGLRTSWK